MIKVRFQHLPTVVSSDSLTHEKKVYMHVQKQPRSGTSYLYVRFLM